MNPTTTRPHPHVAPTVVATSLHSTSNASRQNTEQHRGAEDDSEVEDTSDESEDDESEDEAILQEDFATFKRRVRVEETQRAEGNRRAGGLKTQKAMIKAWKVSYVSLLWFLANNFLIGICLYCP